jgi:hypothetical protein
VESGDLAVKQLRKYRTDIAPYLHIPDNRYIHMDKYYHDPLLYDAFCLKSLTDRDDYNSDSHIQLDRD